VLDFLAWFEGEKVRHSVLKEHFVVKSESTNRRLRVAVETIIPGKPMAHRPIPLKKRMYVQQLTVILNGLIGAGFVERCEERPLTIHGDERQRPQVYFKVATNQMVDLPIPIASAVMANGLVPDKKDTSLWDEIRERLREIDLDPSAIDDDIFHETMEEIARAITSSDGKMPITKDGKGYKINGRRRRAADDLLLDG
jgi:hypothetical protein